MQTVNFQCGHCGKLMAVGRDNLGQQVRCPHCQQVVLAPTSDGPAPASPEEPSPFGDLTEHEDIFTQKSETDDVLFGEGDAPKLNMPREPEPTPFSSNGPSEPELTPIHPPEAPPPTPPLFANEPPSPMTDSLPWQQPAQSGAVSDTPAYVPPRQPRERKEPLVSPTFLMLVFAPTLLWALGATGIAYWLYTKASAANVSPNDPFDKMPDDGDNPGVKKARVVSKLVTTEKFATSPLPDHLKVNLGEAIVVGDLEVTPIGVSRKRVSIMVEGSKQPQPCEYESLVLDLKFKNLSGEYAFAPLDNYFDRKYKGIGAVPLTLVQAGDRPFFGGAHEWVPPLRSKETKTNRQWPLGRRDVDTSGLKPGQVTTGFVATDGWNEKTAAFFFGGGGKKPYRGSLTWRVQVRRGPHEHRGRMLSATTVIGVAFSDKDYLN